MKEAIAEVSALPESDRGERSLEAGLGRKLDIDEFVAQARERHGGK